MHILLDMDGVIADFVTAALRLHGGAEALANWPPGEWDMAKVLGLGTSAFWQPIDKMGADFWADLKPYAWTPQLISLIEEFAPYTILSSPGLGEEAPTGKIRWLREHVKSDFASYLFGHQKWLCAKPGQVLIDDRDKNVDLFIAAGGNAILFPQVWNANHAIKDRMTFVAGELSRLANVIG
ncbi:hypothetical protein OAH18_01485 [bacterium]|nr:hypothetical protein [bacterium]